MPRTLKIYPPIGIARLGDHPDDFFLAPEVPGQGPLELTADDSIVPVRSVRAAGMVRRQGARFRIMEVETDEAGAVVDAREITANDAEIEWHVELANEKAAAGKFAGESQPETAVRRNPGVPEDQLIIRPLFPALSGADEIATASSPGRFKGVAVYLGELRSDAKGRLIVLGGRGTSASVPEGRPIGDEPNPSQNNFANNEFWYDDIADGPVSATVTLPGQRAIELADAWVIVAPPDFAPPTRGLATMYDVAFQAAVYNGWLAAPATPSFKRDILPILRAVSNYRWVSDFAFWENFPTDWAALGKVANQTLREDTRTSLRDVEDFLVAHFTFTETQAAALDKWAEGDFLEDFDELDPPPSITPDGLTRAALEQGVGGGFFPGIEAGIMSTYRELYAEPFRIKRTPFQRSGRQFRPRSGLLTRNMACPWQADFWECKFQGPESIWWPAQRPIEVQVRQGDTMVRQGWDRGVGDHRELLERVMKLGFVLPETIGGNEALVETDRELP